MSQILKIILKHLLSILLVTFLIFALVQLIPGDPASITLAKPVIYLYPEETTDVTVELTLDGALTAVYPAYEGSWRITAQPDGTLSDSNGREYYCLYWEGKTGADFDLSRGFCVPGDQSAAFLENTLAQLGLTEREANEFIIYWLPQLEANPYNLITFQTESYTNAAKLTVSPAPDTMLRVFMVWQGLDAPVEIEPQLLTAPARSGFTVVEWGGSKIQ